MARTRNIKPGFFNNEALAECDPLARILFAGLWTVADREGRLEDRPRRIKADLLPYDACNADELLDQLAANNFIIRYEIDGSRYIQITKWLKHQQPHYKEVGSIIPPPPGHTDTQYVAFGPTEAERLKVFERDNHRCVSCGSTTRLSLDHIIPRSRGGTDDWTNLQTLCGSCNSAKNNRLAAEVGSSSVQGQSEVGSSKVPDDLLDTSSLNLDTLTLIPEKARSAKTRPVPKPQSSTKTCLPTEFPLTPDMMMWAESEGIPDHVDVGLATRAFIEYWSEGEGQGEKRKNWVTMWRSRMRELRDRAIAQEKGAKHGVAARNGKSPTRFDSYRRAAEGIAREAREAETVDPFGLLDSGTHGTG